MAYAITSEFQATCYSPFSHFIRSNVLLVFLFFRPFASPFQRMSETWRTDVFMSMKSQLAFRDYVPNDIDRAPFLNYFISPRFRCKIVRTYLHAYFFSIFITNKFYTRSSINYKSYSREIVRRRFLTYLFIQ